jgi:broad specificity phosphatase PhoE
MDSPLSARGLEQCERLQAFLRTPCVDARAKPDFDALTAGEGYSLIVSSQLRRAASTVAIALSDRISRSRESIVLASSLQEISRNFDTLGLAPAAEAPKRDATLELRAPATKFDPSANGGNKSFSFDGMARVHAFAKWACDRPESTIIVGGHSLWFKSFFNVFLPPDSDHQAKSRKLVNCGIVGFTLQAGRDARGNAKYRVDPASLAVVYGGFETKGK